MNKPQLRLFNKNFTLLLSSQCATLLGSTVYSVVLVLYLKQLTGSATVIGIVELLAFLPWVILGPFAGAMVDRMSEKTVIVLSFFFRGILMLMLSLFSLDFFFTLKVVDRGFSEFTLPAYPFPVYAVFVVTLCMGIIDSAFNAALYSIIPRILNNECIQRGNSMFQGVGGVLAMIGNALGGMIFAVTGGTLVFLLNGISYFTAAAAGLFLSFGPKQHAVAKRKVTRGFFGDVKEGFDFIWTNKGLRSQTIVYSLSNLFFPTVMLSLPFLIEDVLKFGTAYYGYLLSTLTLSSIVGYLGFGLLKTTDKQNYVVICVIFIAEALLFLLLSVTKNCYLDFALLALVSICMAISKLINTSIKQKVIPEALRGRVFATLDSINGGLVPLSFAVGGILIDKVHKNIPLIYGMIFGVYSVLAVWFVMSKSIRMFYLALPSHGKESSL